MEKSQRNPCLLGFLYGYFLKVDEGERKWEKGLIKDDTLICVASKIGSSEQKLTAGYPKQLLEMDLGDPLFTIVIPGNLHFMEAYSLVYFAGAPEEIIQDE